MEGWFVAFQLPAGTPAADRVRFNHELWGRTTSSWGGKYRYEVPGLMESIPHRRLIRGVFLIGAKDRDHVVEFLDRWNAKHHVRQVRLTAGDARSFKGRP